MQQTILKAIVKNKDLIVPTLFKPVQFQIIEKLEKGKRLDDNEKRYMRGKMKQKLIALEGLSRTESCFDPLTLILESIGSYYITGLEALKHNGYGWYYEPKFVEVINTKIEGKLIAGGKTLKFIRVKSITNSKIKVDKSTGIRYATNEQIMKDIAYTKNVYTDMVGKQMLSRYGRLFVRDYHRYIGKIKDEEEIDFSKFGV